MNASLAFKHQDQAGLQKGTRDAVASICLISGCSIEPAMMQATLTTMKEFILNYFGYLTVDEIQEAFQMNAVGKLDRRVQHFNRSLNCDYVGEVLQLYADYRAKLMPDIQKAYNRVALPEKTEVEAVSDADRKNMLSVAYAMYRKWPEGEFFGVSRLYDYAVAFGFIEGGEHEKIVEQAAAKMRGKIARDLDRQPHNRTGVRQEMAVQLEQLSGRAKMDETMKRRVEVQAMDIALRNVFKKFVTEGREFIFAPSSQKADGPECS